MNDLAALLGLDPAQLTTILTITAIVVVVLFVLRAIKKITGFILRLGCLGLLVLIGGYIAMNFVAGG